MKGLQIKTRKDWCIAFVFAAFLSYAVSSFFVDWFQGFLLRYGNPMLTQMNQPRSYENVAFTILVLTLLVEILLICKKRKRKILLLCPFVGIILSAAVIAGYFAHVDLIVSTAENRDAVSMYISPWGRGADLTFTEKEEHEIEELCKQLKPVSKEKQKELEEQVLDEHGGFPEESEFIWCRYPKQYGHNYEMRVGVVKQSIFVFKGYDNQQRAIIVFMEDNGLLDYFSLSH